MKLSDIHQTLTERPGGFGGIMKAKAKKQLSPFMKGKQGAADDEVRLIKVARGMKKDLKGWMTKAFRSTGGAKAPLTMNQFLGWVKKAQPKYAKGIETYARGDSDYAKYFGQAKPEAAANGKEEKPGKHEVQGTDGDKLELEKDPKARTDKQKEDDATRATYKKMGDEQEAERVKSEEGDTQDLKASKGEDKEPKVDTSASIYEARLRAILEADEEAEAKPTKPLGLEDNQIDTLITMGIEKQIELDGGESIVDSPEEMTSKGSSNDSSGGAGGGEPVDNFVDEYRHELENVLTKVKNGAELDKTDQRDANTMLGSL